MLRILDKNILLTLALSALSFSSCKTLSNGLAFDKAAFLHTTCGSNPYYMIHNHFAGVNEIIKLDQDFEAPRAIRYTINGYSACIRIDQKYPGGYKSVIGETLGKLGKAAHILPDRAYPKPLFAYEYSNGFPFMLLLKSAGEFASFRKHLETELAKCSAMPPFKPVLVMLIRNDLTLSTLTDADRSFISKHFSLESLENDEVRKAFEQCWHRYKSENNTMGYPQYESETPIETVFRLLQRKFSNFEMDRMLASALWTLSCTAGAIASYQYCKPALENAAQKIYSCVTTSLPKILS